LMLKIFANSCSPKTLMSKLGVFKVELGLCHPISFPSVMLSDFSASLQLAWERSCFFTLQLIYPKLALNFLKYKSSGHQVQLWV
jgi:hypothetical protein